ncbi:MAG: ester cyclase [Flavisolibacter sp.]
MKKEIVKKWIKALDANDFETIENLMADNYQFRNPIAPAPINGREHLGMMHMMKSSFDAQHQLEMIIEEDNYVVMSAKWTGKHIGEFNGVLATGKVIEFYLIDCFYIVDGKVLRHHIEFNPMHLMGIAE